MVVRLVPDQALGNNPSPRPQPELARLAGIGQQHGRSSVRDLRGRTSGVQPIRQYRLEPGEHLQAGLAQALVPFDDPGLASRLAVGVQQGRLHWRYLPVKPSFGPGSLGVSLRAQPERVDLLAGQATPSRDPLCRLELIRHVNRPRLRPRRAYAGADIRAEPDAAHSL